MLKPIMFWGASGHAKALHEFMPALGFELVALVDNQKGITSPIANVPVLHGKEGVDDWLQRREDRGLVHSLIAIGGARGKDRVELQSLLKAKGISPIIAVHPTAFVARDAQLGEGCQALAMAAVCAGTRIGDCCIVNTRAGVDHECVLGNGVHIGPGATLAGCVTVGDFSFLGAGAVVLPRITIGSNSIIGAGAVVTKNVPDNVVVFGNPARVIRSNA
jgi:sugar O-acyltransferase (sialic acid O-acetyltransferase NeuD family)